jgi:uroporphyrinogen decarboxylase
MGINYNNNLIKESLVYGEFLGINYMQASEKKFIQAINGATFDVPPIWFMRQAGRYLPEYRATRNQAGSFLNLCYSSELATEVTLQPIRRYDFDAAILFADILLIPDAIGQDVTFKEGVGPLLNPIRSVEGLSKLTLDNLHSHLGPIYETVNKLSDRLPDHTALIGFAGAPWTVATYMVGGQGSKDQAETKSWAFKDPDGFQQLIDLLTEATSAYLVAQIQAGAEVIQIFDTWAGGLPENAFRRWCIEPVRRIIAAIHENYPDIPVIGFPRGAGPLYEDFIAETGVKAVSIDTGMKTTWARDNLQSKVCLQGNLDPLALVAGGAVMEAEIDKCLEVLSDGPYVFNLGHGIVPQTPPEHVGQAVDRIRAFNK